MFRRFPWSLHTLSANPLYGRNSIFPNPCKVKRGGQGLGPWVARTWMLFGKTNMEKESLHYRKLEMSPANAWWNRKKLGAGWPLPSRTPVNFQDASGLFTQGTKLLNQVTNPGFVGFSYSVAHGTIYIYNVIYAITFLYLFFYTHK